MRNETSSRISRHPRLAAAFGAAAIAACAALLSGCGTDGATLARVGGETITAGEYRMAAFNAGGLYEGAPDSARAQLLDDMIRRALMLHYGRTSGVVVDSLFERYREQTEREVLIGALSGRLVPRTVPVSEAEISTLHAWRDSSSHCRVIFTPNRMMADAARAALDHGEPFEITANRFNAAGMLPPGGDLGYLLPGALVDPLDTIVRTAPVGEVLGPIEAPGEGWFLVRVVARRAEEPVELSEARPQLTQMLRQRKRRALSVAAFRNLREAYDIRLEPGAEQMLQAFVQPPGMRFGEPPPDPSAEERAQVLARWDAGPGRAGTYTLGDAVDELDSGIQERPDAAMLSSFRPWIESRVMQRVATAEAKRRRLMDEPDVARQLRERMESFLLETVYNDAVTRVTQPAEADYRTAFEQFDAENKGAFESMSEDLRRHLEGEAFRLASERRLMAFTDSLRQSVPVRIDAGLLRRLPRPSGVLFRG